MRGVAVSVCWTRAGFPIHARTSEVAFLSARPCSIVCISFSGEKECQLQQITALGRFAINSAEICSGLARVRTSHRGMLGTGVFAKAQIARLRRRIGKISEVFVRCSGDHVSRILGVAADAERTAAFWEGLTTSKSGVSWPSSGQPTYIFQLFGRAEHSVISCSTSGGMFARSSG